MTSVPPEPTPPEPTLIKLDQFLKLVGVAPTGGHAKMLIRDEVVQVNGEIETRRGRKLAAGDQVSVEGQTFVVELVEEEA
jgi:ribosome-associated protein